MQLVSTIRYSVLDSGAARRFGLTIIPQAAQLRAFGRDTSVARAIVPGLKLGPVTASFPCLAADIPFSGVDAIIGLDVLRRQDFTIDYQARKIVFGEPQPMEDRVAFEREARLLIVPLRIAGRTLHMSMDTGVDGICLYEENSQIWTFGQTGAAQLTVIHLGGETPGRQIGLARVLMGSCEWIGLKAAVLTPTQLLGRDGTLGVVSLGLARIHFDFSHGLISWQR